VNTVSGTHGLTGASDAILVFARTRESSEAVLHITGRDVEEARYSLSFAGGRWTLLDTPASDLDLTDERRRLVHLLRDQGPMRPKQVADALGIEHENAKKLCRRAADGKHVETDGNGYYFTPAEVSPTVPLSLLPLDGDSGTSGDRPTEGAA